MDNEKILKLIILCNAGLSSSFVVDRIEKEFEKKKIPMEITSQSLAGLQTNLDNVDLVLIAPQLRSMEREVKEKCENAGKPFLFVDQSFYGFDENTVFTEKILEILNWK